MSRVELFWKRFLLTGGLLVLLQARGLGDPFAGVTALTVAERAAGKALQISFTSDRPFHYRLEILDPNRVRLHLINARLSDRLKGPNGQLKLPTTPGFQKAYSETVSTGGADEVLILEGHGLGERQLSIQGASPVPVSKTALNTNAMTPDGFEDGRINLDPLQPALNPSKTPDTEAIALSPPEDAEAAFLALLAADADPATLPRLSREAPSAPERVDLVPTKPEPPEKPEPLTIQDLQPEEHPPETVMAAPAQKTSSQTFPDFQAGFQRVPENSAGPQVAQIREIPYHDPIRSRIIPVAPPQYGQYQYPQYEYYASPPAYYAYPPAAVYAAPAYPPSAAALAERPVTPEQQVQAPAETVSEPGNTEVPVKPLPRYTGGAPPIAFTLSGSDKVYTLPPGAVTQGVAIGPDPSDEALNALSFDPATAQESAEAHMHLALSHYRRKNYDRALELVEQAARMAPENSKILAALGEIQMTLENPKAAVKAYADALEKSSGKSAEKSSGQADKRQYLERYAVALYRQGDRDAAIETIETLLSDPKTAALARDRYLIHLILGTLYQEKGDPQKALPQLERAAALNPGSADAHYNLGLAYELTGRREEARTHYTQALRLNPDARDVALALERVKGPVRGLF